MDINPAMNYYTDIHVLGDTEINVEMLHRFSHN